VLLGPWPIETAIQRHKGACHNVICIDTVLYAYQQLSFPHHHQAFIVIIEYGHVQTKSVDIMAHPNYRNFPYGRFNVMHEFNSTVVFNLSSPSPRGTGKTRMQHSCMAAVGQERISLSFHPLLPKIRTSPYLNAIDAGIRGLHTRPEFVFH
jgi:hypothetical protein